MVYRAFKISPSSSLPNIEDTNDMGLRNRGVRKGGTATERIQLDTPWVPCIDVWSPVKDE